MCVGNETKPELDELWAPMRSESLTSKMRRCMLPFAGLNPAFHYGWDPIRFTILRCSPRSGGSEAASCELVKELGIDVVHQPTPVRPGCQVSSSTFLLRW